MNAAKRDIKSPSILVVEDNVDHLKIISHHIKAHFAKATIVAAKNAAEAIASAEQNKPDLIVLDLHLGKSKGGEVLRALPKATRDYPILVLTSDRTEESLDEAFAEGADDYLTKPIDELVFESKVQTLLSGKYVSPIVFFGTGEGITPLAMQFKVDLDYICETHVRFFSPVLIAKGAKVRVNLGGLELVTNVTECNRTNATDVIYSITSTIPEDPVIENQAKIRKFIHMRNQLFK